MPPGLTRPRPPQLSPFDIASFRTRRTALRDEYRRGVAANDLAVGDAQASYANDYQGLLQSYGQKRNQLAGGFAQRGLLNSGIYRQGLTDFYGNRTQDFGNLSMGLQSQLGQLNLQRLQLAQGLRSGLDQVAAEQLARRAQIAATLRGQAGGGS
jgi:hypothetical protein